MTYQLTAFGSVTLPIWDPAGDIGTAPTQNLIIPTLAGVHDAGGTAVGGPQYPYELLYSCTASGDTQALLQTTVDALRAMRGQRQKLYRESVTGIEQWAWARIGRIPQDVKQALFLHQPLTFTFQVLGQWHGVPHTTWYLDTGEYLDTGLFFGEEDTITLPNNVTQEPFTLTNGGNAYVTGVALTLTAGSAPVTRFEWAITAMNVSAYYDGTVAAGQSLVIDSGSYTIRNQATDDYAHYHRNTGHKISEFIKLAPGANTLLASINGGGNGTLLAAAFHEGWE